MAIEIQKKVIAREFLILIGVPLVAGLIWLGCLAYNGILELRTTRLNAQRSIAAENARQLITTLDSKELIIKWNYRTGIPKWNYRNGIPDTGKLYSVKDFAKRVKRDGSYKDVDNFELVTKIVKSYPEYAYWLESIPDAKIIPGTILGNTYSNYNSALQQSKGLINIHQMRNAHEELLRLNEKDVKILQDLRSPVYTVELVRAFLISLAVCAGVMFPLRYFFYAVQWSIRTLREDTDSFAQTEEQAKADREYFDNIVKLAKEYIKLGVVNVKDFISEVSDTVDESIAKLAFEVAQGKKPTPDSRKLQKVINKSIEGKASKTSEKVTQDTIDKSDNIEKSIGLNDANLNELITSPLNSKLLKAKRWMMIQKTMEILNRKR